MIELCFVFSLLVSPADCLIQRLKLCNIDKFASRLQCVMCICHMISCPHHCPPLEMVWMGWIQCSCEFFLCISNPNKTTVLEFCAASEDDFQCFVWILWFLPDSVKFSNLSSEELQQIPVSMWLVEFAIFFLLLFACCDLVCSPMLWFSHLDIQFHSHNAMLQPCTAKFLGIPLPSICPFEFHLWTLFWESFCCSDGLEGAQFVMMSRSNHLTI